jgi:hypothetical protein
MISQMISTLERHVEQLHVAINALRALDGAALELKAKVKPKPQAEPVQRQRRAPIAEGSLPDRIIDMLRQAGEPTKKSLIVKHAGAREYDVTMALQALVKDARIVKTGTTASVRYQLPR